ncbi:MAG: sigma factor [Acidimicrobiales bacterium]
MNDSSPLSGGFEEHRSHLHAVAYRMLGSSTEADDAVQESWLRAARSDTSAIHNLGGWLTTVVARVCLDMLRSRRSRGEVAMDPEGLGALALTKSGPGPEDQALIDEQVGPALLVVLDKLSRSEICLICHFGRDRASEPPVAG